MKYETQEHWRCWECINSEENNSWVNDTVGAGKKHTMVAGYHESKVMLQLYLFEMWSPL